MSDEEFLRYIESMCNTPDAGVVPAHIARLYALSGDEQQAAAWREAPLRVIRREHAALRTLVRAARERMATAEVETPKVDIPRDGERLRVTVYDGKYTVVQSANGGLHALRYGEPWRDCVGDGLILALAQAVEALRAGTEGAQAVDDALAVAWEAHVQRRWGGWTSFADVHTQSSARLVKESFAEGYRAARTQGQNDG
jgi:hypothetical protein